ncbi:MAG: hypothetical protein J0I48_12200 [Devosia sp.]|uniref:hypothetical protein n=1 Tax=Devosia sp. 66-22 TaxID=1895753 RepID=UPI001ACB4677|nr:hypothetical protein [Devosia sp. 66-22]MBN9346942.1 hypothetical protein [Devosia sp.]
MENAEAGPRGHDSSTYELVAGAASRGARSRPPYGHALATLGGRESSTARLEEAVAAFRLALEERSRERVPLDWATTQNNLGNALKTLGERVMSRQVLVDARSAITNSWDVYREAGYQQHDAYFANLIATVDAALANLD